MVGHVLPVLAVKMSVQHMLSGKALNPMQIIHDVRAYANEHSELLFKGEAPEEDMISRFGEAAIWACTTCNACVDVCPS